MPKYLYINSGIITSTTPKTTMNRSIPHDTVVLDEYDVFNVGMKYDALKIAKIEKNIKLAKKTAIDSDIKKLILLNSGGLDSLATCEIIYKRKEELNITDVLSVFIDVGLSTGPQQEQSAKNISDFFNIPHKTVKIDFGIDVTNFRQDLDIDDPRSSGNIGYPSTVFLSIGMSLARMIGYDAITSGSRNDPFLDRDMLFKNMLSLQGQSGRSEQSPLKDIKIAGIIPKDWSYDDVYQSIDLGKELISQTISCLKSVPGCGKCHKCVSRNHI